VNLWDALTEPAAPTNSLHTWHDDRFVSRSWADCVTRARVKAAALRGLGVKPGVSVGCVLTNSVDVCTSILGIWLAGGTVVSLPTLARGMAPDAYIAQLRSLCQHVGTELLLIEDRFASALDASGDLGPEIATYESLRGSGNLAPEPPAEDDVAFIQYSSGTTSEPRGCMITAKAIAAQLEISANRLSIDRDRDRGVMWLPLSHDMGVFGGLLFSWVTGIQLTLGTPERFLTSPRTWAQDCVDFSATLTAGPNFAMKIAARAAEVSPPSGPLELRAWVIGSDRIEWPTLEAAVTALEPYGAKLSSLVPVYGLAEATLAVTLATPGEVPPTVGVDSTALLSGEVREAAPKAADATRMVSSGHALEGVEVRIDSEAPLGDGLAAPEESAGNTRTEGGSAVGEICVRSPSLALGYVSDASRTQERFRDGELRTGDLGFLAEGQLYVVGRADDMLSPGGRNIHASELEALFAREPGVRSGGCALVDVVEQDEERLVVLLETREGVTEFQDLAESIRRIAATRSGVRIEECVFLPRGMLPKTPSGKLQRFRCRQLARHDELPVLERVKL
jgi:fatty-acyl-CoA synthase